MAQEWNPNVNKKAYGADGGYTENTERVEFKSGRTVFYRKNSTARKTHALNFYFDDKKDVYGKTEFQWFLEWYEVTVQCGALSFYFPDVSAGTGTREYYITEAPKWRGQAQKEVSMTFEEA